MKIINRTVLWVILSSIALAPGSLAQQQPNRPANPSIDPATQEQLASAQRAVDAQDYATALRIYHPLAERGVAAAQGGIARHYFNGWGVERNDAEALRWGRLGAAQNNALSFNVLGSAYANGRGVTQSDTEAVRWFRLAADQSFASAQNALGFMYENGRGVAKSDTEAVRLYRLAANQGNAAAQKKMQELEPRLRQQQEAAAYQERVLAYQKRDKTLLEQVLNYTATGNEDGNQFSRWISGDQGKHKCVMTLLHGAGLFDMLRGQLGELDIRQINKDGFRISTQYGNDGKPRIVAGDEKINVSSFVFLGSPPVMERLQKGWNLVFSECPSAVRRQF